MEYINSSSSSSFPFSSSHFILLLLVNSSLLLLLETICIYFERQKHRLTMGISLFNRRPNTVSNSSNINEQQTASTVEHPPLENSSSSSSSIPQNAVQPRTLAEAFNPFSVDEDFAPGSFEGLFLDYTIDNQQDIPELEVNSPLSPMKRKRNTDPGIGFEPANTQTNVGFCDYDDHDKTKQAARKKLKTNGNAENLPAVNSDYGEPLADTPANNVPLVNISCIDEIIATGHNTNPGQDGVGTQNIHPQDTHYKEVYQCQHPQCKESETKKTFETLKGLKTHLETHYGKFMCPFHLNNKCKYKMNDGKSTKAHSMGVCGHLSKHSRSPVWKFYMLRDHFNFDNEESVKDKFIKYENKKSSTPFEKEPGICAECGIHFDNALDFLYHIGCSAKKNDGSRAAMIERCQHIGGYSPVLKYGEKEVQEKKDLIEESKNNVQLLLTSSTMLPCKGNTKTNQPADKIV